MRTRITAAVAALAATAGLALAAPAAQAATCTVRVTATSTSVTAHRTAGSCRIEAWGHFNVPGQNGVFVAGPDATSGYSVAYDQGYQRSGSYGWRLS